MINKPDQPETCNLKLETNIHMEKPNLSFWNLWNLSFGFFGVQIAYSLQSANISGIFATLGADPHTLSFFWVLPPLMGMLVQPVVGTLSDKTWTRFGRRIPYLFVGAAVAVAVMCLLPNAGSFGLTVGAALWFGAFALMLLDTSINMAMQPFKMMVGDMVNEKQKGKAYSIQSFLCNAGGLVGFVFPFFFTAIGIANTAPEGQVPDSVVYSFYIGAVILILCVIYTVMKVKEWPPKEYLAYNPAPAEEEKASWLSLLKKAPAAFWQVAGLSGCTQLDGYCVWCSDPWCCRVGDGASYVPQYEGGLCVQSGIGWHRFCHRSFHHQSVYALPAVPAHRLRLGCHARHAVRFGY